MVEKLVEKILAKGGHLQASIHDLAPTVGLRVASRIKVSRGIQAFQGIQASVRQGHMDNLPLECRRHCCLVGRWPEIQAHRESTSSTDRPVKLSGIHQ